MRANSKELSSFDKIESVLFKSRDEASHKLNNIEMEQKNRWMLCVSKLLDDPITEDKELVEFLVGGCGGSCKAVSKTTAYRDIASIKRLVGNIQLSSKSWYRHMIIESAKKGIKIAIEEKDAKGVAANIDKIGKYTRANMEDDEVDRSLWNPPVFEPTDDVTLLGDNFTPIKNLEEERKKFRAIFKGEMTDVQPIEEDDDGTEDG